MRTAAVLLSMCLAIGLAGQAFAQERRPAFTDPLTTIDESRWRVADGWSNGEWTANDWRRSQIRAVPGGTEIVLARSRDGEKRYSSGELQSEEVYRYGYFETRMRVPRGSGLVTGFFTYTRPAAENTWDEIDIEILGRDTRSIQFTYFRRGERNITTLPLPFDAAEAQHTYGFEWTPRAIRWYVDGRLMHEENGANGALPQAPQRLYLHLWNTETLTDWLGPILPWQGPWRLTVSCIAYAPSYAGRQLCSE
ncbi:MAG TPA: family 16 glycosylhydrolase [Vitreimonas sp.]|uniref:family 16 glycosylhydrolase n=1 Tax=Vitreimonas sp. TaxID=3069702 RepID=UPI002D6D7C6B|nr:family 16 glycosylhydrolase [Vitreimonas sp.]HYD88947.1 family 16 glycosylhydrolase [Vitreimonas sp.]